MCTIIIVNYIRIDITVTDIVFQTLKDQEENHLILKKTSFSKQIAWNSLNGFS